MNATVIYESIYLRSKVTTYRVEKREVRALMDTPAVRAVLDMGFDRSIVQQVIREQLAKGGLVSQSVNEKFY